MSDISLKPISAARDFDDVLDLTERARDYVVLEVGHPANDAYVRDFFEACPPGKTPDSLIHFAVMRDQEMAGIVGIASGYEQPDDWWIGLMLLDPAYRGRRIGHTVIKLIRRLARNEGIAMLKLSVLDANPRGESFWRREGFVMHRAAPATPESDGHDRVVLRYQIREDD